MFPANIEQYVRPQSVAEALAACAGYDAGEAMFIAGGQSLMQAMKSRMARPRCLIDLQAISELQGICPDEGAFHIGAMTRYVSIANDERLTGYFAALRDARIHPSSTDDLDRAIDLAKARLDAESRERQANVDVLLQELVHLRAYGIELRESVPTAALGVRNLAVLADEELRVRHAVVP
jgi:hypothetical protein